MTLFTWLKRMGKLGLLSGSTSRTHSVPCIKLVSRWHSNLRWAIGLFMYQSLDAVDGWVDTFAPVYISAYPTVGNRHGEREWQVLWEKCLIMVCVRVSWRASIFTFFFHRLRRTQHYSMLAALQVAFLVLSFVLFSLRSFLRRVRLILAARGGLLHRKLPPLPISI